MMTDARTLERIRDIERHLEEVMARDVPGVMPGVNVRTMYGARGDGSTDDSTALQAAFDDAYASGVPVYIPTGVYHFGTTLEIKGDDLRIFGPGWRDRQSLVKLVYTGTGDGIDVTLGGATRLWGLDMRGVTLECNNSSNTGWGMNLESLNLFNLENVWISGFGDGTSGGGLRIYSNDDTGLADIRIKRVEIFQCANGMLVDGTTTVVADSVFDSITVREMLNSDDTGNANAFGIKAGQGTSRNKFIGCIYKQSSGNALDSALVDEGAGNMWIACGGEINQSANEIEVTANADRSTWVGCAIQSADRLSDSGTDTCIVGAQESLKKSSVRDSQPVAIFDHIASPASDIAQFGVDGATEVAVTQDGDVDINQNTLLGHRASSLADDAVHSFAPNQVEGLLMIWEATGRVHNGVLMFRVTSTSGPEMLSVASNGITVTTGALTGTTGTDGELTVSAHTDGNVYIENRTGVSLFMGYVVLGAV